MRVVRLPRFSTLHHTGMPFFNIYLYQVNGMAVTNPAVSTPRPSRGPRIESCDFIVLIGDP